MNKLLIQVQLQYFKNQISQLSISDGWFFIALNQENDHLEEEKANEIDSRCKNADRGHKESE